MTVTPTSPDRGTVAGVRRLLDCPGIHVTGPADPAWDLARQAWSLTVDQHPVAVVEVSSAQDVAHVVGVAAGYGLAVAPQPGGHGATGAVSGAILLRTGALDEIWIDADARVARVGAGVKQGALLAALRGTGLVALVGSNPDVSVVGFLLGGGLSWFSRKYGLAAHGLRAAEIVDAAGRRRWVDDASDPDLLWALRGGGGAFAVVTAVEITLEPEPHICGGKLMFPIDAGRAVLRAFTEATQAAPRELSLWASILHLPPASEVPEPLRGRSLVGIDVGWLGGPAPLAVLLAGIRAAAPPVLDTIGPVEVGAIGDIAAEPTDPTPARHDATLLDRFDDDTIDRLLAAVGDPASPIGGVQVRQLGGALRDDRWERGVAGGVAEPYMLNALGMLTGPESAPALEQAFRTLARALEPERTGRVVASFLAPGQGLERVYSAERLAQLRAIKRACDPAQVFRSNVPVPD
jgi:FAD/FMN-containing dehydrogenase